MSSLVCFVGSSAAPSSCEWQAMQLLSSGGGPPLWAWGAAGGSAAAAAPVPNRTAQEAAAIARSSSLRMSAPLRKVDPGGHRQDEDHGDPAQDREQARAQGRAGLAAIQ